MLVQRGYYDPACVQRDVLLVVSVGPCAAKPLLIVHVLSLSSVTDSTHNMPALQQCALSGHCNLVLLLLGVGPCVVTFLTFRYQGHAAHPGGTAAAPAVTETWRWRDTGSFCLQAINAYEPH